METREPSSMSWKVIVKVVTWTFSGTSTSVWKKVKSPYTSHVWPFGAEQTTEPVGPHGWRKSMVLGSGAGTQFDAFTGGTTATSYSQGSPCSLGTQLNFTRFVVGSYSLVTPTPKFICQGVRDCAPAFAPIDRTQPANPIPIQPPRFMGDSSRRPSHRPRSGRTSRATPARVRRSAGGQSPFARQECQRKIVVMHVTNSFS